MMIVEEPFLRVPNESDIDYKNRYLKYKHKGAELMTELEEQFFKTFGILPIMVATFVYKYPEITAERLLELICIISKYKYVLEDIFAKTVGELKKQILELYIGQRIFEDEETLRQVQALFEGDNENP